MDATAPAADQMLELADPLDVDPGLTEYLNLQGVPTMVQYQVIKTGLGPVAAGQERALGARPLPDRAAVSPELVLCGFRVGLSIRPRRDPERRSGDVEDARHAGRPDVPPPEACPRPPRKPDPAPLG